MLGDFIFDNNRGNKSISLIPSLSIYWTDSKVSIIEIFTTKQTTVSDMELDDIVCGTYGGSRDVPDDDSTQTYSHVISTDTSDDVKRDTPRRDKWR